MEKLKQLLNDLQTGALVPIYRELEYERYSDSFFKALTQNGTQPHCFYLDSDNKTIGGYNPAVRISGKKDRFEILALNPTGERILHYLRDSFGIADTINITKTKISGTLKPVVGLSNPDEQLYAKNHAALLRILNFSFRPTTQPFKVYGGLFGVFSYDFIDQMEDLPSNKEDLLKDEDYVFYLAYSLYYLDHKQKQFYIIVNAYKVNDDAQILYEECKKELDRLHANLEIMPAIDHVPQIKDLDPVHTDYTEKEYIQIVKKCKEKIKDGYVFQIVPSRMIYQKTNLPPFYIYEKLKQVNPSPYMFFFNFGQDYLLGASPEMSVVVNNIDQKGTQRVEIRPIAGTKPRGKVLGTKLPGDLDMRLECELRTDPKELSEHMMLVDLGRNDIARISEPGTRKVDDLLVVEKYSHVQHLVSSVSGILKKGMDCLTAYLAIMNHGTMTGAPKYEAMKLLRQMEKYARGFYAGSVGYITPGGEMQTGIVIRSIRIKNGYAYLRAAAGIVADSDPKSEFEETHKKLSAGLAVLMEEV